MQIIIYKAGISSGLFQVAGSLKKKTFYKEMGQEKYEKIYKPDFVSRSGNRMPVIYLRAALLHHLS